jgi:phenylpyruvate tautomerase PptA (4-oxalocrotonate tautomerase family)
MRQNIQSMLCVLVSCFCLSGCSVSFIYNNLSWLSSWYLDDYVSLSAKQQQQFDEDFNAFQYWHRTTQLVIYYQQLEQLKRQIIKGISEDQIKSHRSLVQTYWTNLITRAKPQLIELTYSLDEAQRNTLLKSIKENNEARYNDNKPDNIESWHQERCEIQQGFYKKWLGRLTNSQKQKICHYIKATSPLAELRFEYSQAWFKNIESALLITISRAEYEYLFTEIITNSNALKSDQYRILLANNTEIYVSLFHVMMNSLNDTQKQHLIAELNELIEVLKILEFDS